MRFARDPGVERVAAGQGHARERPGLVVAGEQPHRIEVGESGFGASLAGARLCPLRRTATAGPATAAAHPSAAAAATASGTAAASRTARTRRRGAHRRIEPGCALPVDGRAQGDELLRVAGGDSRPGDATVGGAEERGGGERTEQQALPPRVCEGCAKSVHVDAQPTHLVPHRLGKRGLLEGKRRGLEHRRGRERVDDSSSRDEPGVESETRTLPFDPAVRADQHRRRAGAEREALRPRVLRVHQRKRRQPEIGSAVERRADAPGDVDAILDAVQGDHDAARIGRVRRDAPDANPVVLGDAVHPDGPARKGAASVFGRIEVPAARDEQGTAGECRGVDCDGGLARGCERARSPARSGVFGAEERALGAGEDPPRIRRIEDRVAEEARAASVARGNHFFRVEEIDLGERPGETAVGGGEYASSRPGGGDQHDARIDGTDEHPLDLHVFVHRGEDSEARVLELERERRCARSCGRRGKRVHAGTAGDCGGCANARQSERKMQTLRPGHMV